MQICIDALRVIFLLSTIVIVTDCCSSRILLAKKHTPVILQQQQQQTVEEQQQEQFREQLQRPPVLADTTDHTAAALLQSSSDSIGSTSASNSSKFSSDSEAINSLNAQPTLFTTTLTLSAESFEAALQTTVNSNDALGISTEQFVLTAPVDENAPTHKPTPPPQPPPDSVDTSTSTSSIDENGSTAASTENVDSLNASNDVITNPTVREQHASNLKYLDAYYVIMSDVLTFQCSGQFLTDFCLNRGRCFRYPVADQNFFSCECADGYVGERCESKSVNGLYATPKLSDVRKQRKILTARIVFSFPMLITISLVYLFFGAIIVSRKCARHRKQQQKQRQQLHHKQAAGRLVS